jgi:methionyl-tRNA synthetase
MTETAIFLGIAGLGLTFFFIFIAWSLAWKGVALWTAARRGSRTWFIILLIVNTLSILEILYVLFFSKKDTFKKIDKKLDKVVEEESEADNDTASKEDTEDKKEN